MEQGRRRSIFGDSHSCLAMMPGGCGGDEDGRERSGRVWLWREGKGDAIVAAVGVMVMEVEGEKS